MTSVILIDDNKDFLNEIRVNLEIREPLWVLLPFTEGPSDTPGKPFWEAALALLAERKRAGNPIDLVLTDLGLPGKNVEAGYTVLARAKQIDPAVMTIVYTAQPELLDRPKAYDLNVYAVVNRMDTQVKVNVAAELHLLSRAALNFRRQQRELGAFRRFADPDVAKAIVENSADARFCKRTLTVVFWDIRGFSKLTQQLEKVPTSVAEFIGEYCDLARDVIARHCGILDKFIGDGVMALFGHPLKGRASPEHSAAAALDAALELNERFDALAARWAAAFKQCPEVTEAIDQPRLGCGIHTAEVLAGYIGSDRGEFTALGHGVNLAARVQDKAHERPILVTRPVKVWAQKAPNGETRHAFDPLPEPVEFKNIPGKHDIFAVRRLR